MDFKETQAAQPEVKANNGLREHSATPAELVPTPGLISYTIPWYELLEELPGGKFCHVFKARRVGIDKLFVVKILKEDLARDPRVAKRFSIETKKASNTNHANLAPTYEYGTTSDDLPYFVTDFIDGKPLSQLISEKGFFQNKEAVEIFIQICDALQEAHSSELLHRHLTPDNVFVTRGENDIPLVKVTDVGIAKVLPTVQEDESGEIKQQHFGDARYMSPEQCRGEKLDERSDIYSLGCLMYHVLGGKPPHKGSSPVYTALKQIEKHPQPLSERFPELDVSLALETVVMRSLQKDKEYRYQNIAELKRDLLTISRVGSTSTDDVSDTQEICVAGQEGTRKFQRLYMVAVFIIATTLTYAAQLTQLPNQILSQQTDMPASYGQPLVNRQQFDVRTTDGRIILSQSGTSLSDVLRLAIRDGKDLRMVDLSEQQLAGIDFSNAKFSGADFSNADLTGANLSGADLRGAQFSSSTMSDANLAGANLEDAIITDSDLTSSRLFGADLKHSYWRDCNLNNANLSTADFTDASVYQVDLPDASRVGTLGLVVQDRFPELARKFSLSSWNGKTLYESKIKQSFKKTVEEAVEHGANLSEADFRAADLTGVNLTGADLRGADLRGALLTDANLTRTNFLGAAARGAVCDLTANELTAANVSGWQAFFPPYTERLSMIDRINQQFRP